MIMKKSFLIVALLTMIFTASVAAAEEITLPDLISDHMMIQRNEEIKLWGTANAGSEITVTLKKSGKKISDVTVKTDDNCRFDAVLPAVSDKGPYELVFSDGTNEKTVSDVLAGDIWIQCGQSNIRFHIAMQTHRIRIPIFTEKRLCKI